MRLYLDFDEQSEEGRYFIACARIRDVGGQSLLRRLFRAICEDQMIAAVLDDSETLKAREKGEHRYPGRPAP